MSDFLRSGDVVYIRTPCGKIYEVDSPSFDRCGLAGRRLTSKNQRGYLGWDATNADGARTTRYVHIEVFGDPVPRGWHVHHCDFDRSNNRRSNLALIDCGTHSTLHHRAGRDVLFRAWVRAPENRHLIHNRENWPVESLATLPKYLRKKPLPTAA